MKKVTREEMERAQGWTDLFQFGTLGLLFGSVFFLEAIPKETAKAIIWYWAGVMFVLATIGFICGRRSAKKTSAYFKGSLESIRSRYDF